MDVVRQLVALFRIDFDERSLAQVDRGVAQARERAGGFVGAMNNAGAAMNGMLWRAAAVVASAAVGGHIVRTIGEFESLEASLRVTTGSAEAAAEAMAFVDEFAKRSSDNVGQIAQAYQMLVAQGLDPSTERLTALGDAAAMAGRPVNDLVDAMAGASIGMPERLSEIFKRYGIDFSAPAGRLMASIGGEMVEIERSFEGVSAFIEHLGKTRFAGGMEAQARTLMGRISMLGDAVSGFIRTMGKSGFNDELKNFIDALAEAFGTGAGLAQVVGTRLAQAFRTLTALVRHATQHADVLLTILKVLGGVVVINGIMQVVAGLRAAAAAGALFTGSVAAMPILVGVAIAAVVLLIDDLFAYLEGRPSLIGTFIDSNEDDRGLVGSFARMLREYIDTSVAAFDRMAQWWQANRDDLRGIVELFRDMIVWINRLPISPLTVYVGLLERMAEAMRNLRWRWEDQAQLEGFDANVYDTLGYVPVDAQGNSLPIENRRELSRFVRGGEDFGSLASSGAAAARTTAPVVVSTPAPVNIGDIIVTANTAADAAVIATEVESRMQRVLSDWMAPAYDRSRSARQ